MREKSSGRSEETKWKKVINVSNDIEYEIIRGLLDMAEIPTLRKTSAMDGYMKIFAGTPLTSGIDILVPVDRYDEAKKLIGNDDN